MTSTRSQTSSATSTFTSSIASFGNWIKITTSSSIRETWPGTTIMVTRAAGRWGWGGVGVRIGVRQPQPRRGFPPLSL